MTTENLSFAAVERRNPQLLLDVNSAPESYRVLTGERPTGRLHVGHYFGTLQNRVKLQDLGVELFILIADYQVFTDRDSSKHISENVLEFMADYLAIGLDPNVCHIFAHSYVKSLNQLMLPFLSMVTVSELNRNPTVKDEIKLSNRSQVSGLMFTYPVHQAADILFCKGNLVPGGKDQLPHIEVARTIARRFNDRFAGQQYFPEPELLLSDAPLLLGTDGRKMGKSLRNSIEIGMSEDETSSLIRKAKTDSISEVTYDPDRRPEVANLLLLGSLCLGVEPADLAHSVRSEGSGKLKAVVTEAVNEYFRPIRALRKQFRSDPGQLLSVLQKGNEYAESIAVGTLEDVRQMMGMRYY